MGRDVDGPHRWIANTVANFDAADILLSSGPYMTRTMYAGAYGVSIDNVAELGSPVGGRQFAPHPAPDVVLYAPTWREASYTDAVDDLADVGARMRAIAQGVPDGLQPMVRVHGKLGEKVRTDPGLAGFWRPTTSAPTHCSHAPIPSSPTTQHRLRPPGHWFSDPLLHARGIPARCVSDRRRAAWSAHRVLQGFRAG